MLTLIIIGPTNRNTKLQIYKLCSLDEPACESEELGSNKVEQGGNNKKHCKGRGLTIKYVKKSVEQRQLQQRIERYFIMQKLKRQ